MRGQNDGITLLDALQATLANNLGIQQNRMNIRVAQGRLRRETSVFDTQFSFSGSQAHTYQPLTDYEHNLAVAAGVNTYQQSLTTSDVHAQGEKLFHFGGRLDTQMDFSRMNDNLENIGGVNRTNLNTTLTVPLLRGRGTQATLAATRAAQLDLDGTVQEWNASTSAVLIGTVDHYFELVSAQARVHLAMQSEDNARQTQTEVQELIAGDKLAQISIHDAEAATERQHLRVLAEQSTLFDARSALASDMGLDIAATQRLTAGNDPLPEPEQLPATVDLGALVQSSLLLRSDVRGAKQHVDAAAVQRAAAANGLKRQLDVSISSGYTGLSLGLGPLDYVDSIGNRIPGGNVTGAITYHFDHGNNAARASFESADAELVRARYGESSLEARLSQEVLSAHNELELARATLESTRSVEQSVEQSAEGTREKLRAGAGPLTDVLAAQDHVLDAELATRNAQMRYAIAIARMRYATGTMLGGDALHPTITRSTFYSEQSPAVTAERSPRP